MLKSFKLPMSFLKNMFEIPEKRKQNGTSSKNNIDSRRKSYLREIIHFNSFYIFMSSRVYFQELLDTITSSTPSIYDSQIFVVCVRINK